jgi:hypothetical protein
MAVTLRDFGARAWQVRLTAPLLAEAVLAADREVAEGKVVVEPTQATDADEPASTPTETP